MKRITVKNRLVLFFAIIIQQSIVIAAPLPLQLPANQQAYLNDQYWTEDAVRANANTNHCVEAADTVNYTDYRYVGAHNAFSYQPHFFKIAFQQDQTILGQLSYGVRGLMFDTYNWTLGWPFSLIGPNGSKVCLSHDAPGFTSVIQKGTNVYQSLKYELRRVVEFMRANPQAVITIMLEDYADRLVTAKEIKEVMAEAQYDVVFKPADLVNNQWPTLGWMRSHNKRLVFFTQRTANTDVTFYEFNYMLENNYGTTDETALCMPRPEARAMGPLVAFNNFKSIGITSPILLTAGPVHYDTAKRVTTNCQAKHFANGRLFNGYWADRVIYSCNGLYLLKQKTIFEYVNELNANPNKTMP